MPFACGGGVDLVTEQGVTCMISNMVMVMRICYGLAAAGLTVALAAGAVGYAAVCARWRRRIAEVREEQPVYLGWNLKKLKETARELEYDKVSRMELLFR